MPHLSPLADVRSRLEAVGRALDKYTMDMDSRLRGMSDTIAEVQSQVRSTVATNLAAVNAELDRVRRDVITLHGTVGDATKSMTALRAASGDADALLARDVAMLADAVSATKAALNTETATLAARVAASASAANDGTRAEADERERRIAAVSRSLAAEIDEVKRGIAALQEEQRKAREATDDVHRAATTESRAITSQVASSEALVQAQLVDVSRKVDEVTRAHAARLEAMSNALHAFANVLNLGKIVVDPRAVLTRSLAAGGVASTTGYTAGAGAVPTYGGSGAASVAPSPMSSFSGGLASSGIGGGGGGGGVTLGAVSPLRASLAALARF